MKADKMENIYPYNGNSSS